VAPRIRKPPVLSRKARVQLTKDVFKACQHEKVPCTNQEAQLVVRVAASLEGSNRGRWFRIPTHVTERLDKILPVVFNTMVDTPNSGSLHAAFNAALCGQLPDGRGFQTRKPKEFWQIRIVSDDQSLATADPVHLEVRK
jgi:hypothetical protein